jgi:hypothetical protein
MLLALTNKTTTRLMPLGSSSENIHEWLKHAKNSETIAIQEPHLLEVGKQSQKNKEL